MPTWQIHISNVQEVADEMGAIAGRIQVLLGRLDDATTQNLAEWTSSARDAYSEAKRIWDQAAADMAAQAVNAHATLRSITDSYALADYHGLGLWT